MVWCGVNPIQKAEHSVEKTKTPVIRGRRVTAESQKPAPERQARHRQLRIKSPFGKGEQSQMGSYSPSAAALIGSGSVLKETRQLSFPVLGKIELSITRGNQVKAAQPLARYVKKECKHPLGWILTDAIDSKFSSLSGYALKTDNISITLSIIFM